MAFQEPIKTDDYYQVVDLLGPDFHVAHHNAEDPVSDGDHNGASVASRWPLAEVREVDLNLTPRTADFPCTTLLSEVLAPDLVGPLLFVNHLPSRQLGFEHERELQVGIDYIMVRCGDHGPALDVSACERIFDEPVDGVWASDHFGVLADLVVPPQRPAAIT